MLKKTIPTISFLAAATVVISLAGCSNYKSSFKGAAQKKLAQLEKTAQKTAKTNSRYVGFFSECRALNYQDLQPTPQNYGGGVAASPSVNFIAHGASKILGTDVVAAVADKGYRDHKSYTYNALRALVSAGLIKPIHVVQNFAMTKNGVQTVNYHKIDYFVWTGPKKDIQTRQYVFYSYKKILNRDVAETYYAVTSICVGHLAVDKIINFTKPGKNSNGETVATADVAFKFVDTPSWFTSKSFGLLVNAGINPALRIKYRTPAVTGKAHMIKTGNGWVTKNFTIPYLERREGAIESEELNNFLR